MQTAVRALGWSELLVTPQGRELGKGEERPPLDALTKQSA
jgi:hypothetical protein